MAKAVFRPEGRTFQDARTGVTIRQITAHPSIHHQPFFYIPAYDEAGRWLFFVSHRAGAPQVFAEERATGELLQLTDRPNLNEWSIHPAHGGEFVYFTAGSGAWRVRVESAKEECLADFGDAPMIPPGMVGDAMGTTALSADDRWWAIPVKVGATAKFHVIDTATGDCRPILEAPVIGHPQFHPRDSDLLHYAGPFHERMWVTRRDGSGHRLAYRRSGKQWIVHEIWNPLARELLAVNWPHGMIGVDIDTGLVRSLGNFRPWHAMISRDGAKLIGDTHFPDSGLRLFDLGGDEAVTLCHPESSNAGEHWNTDHCPYDDGPVKVYAPQHTHPHPSFSPDGQRVVYTSDVTGHSQIYEAVLPSR